MEADRKKAAGAEEEDEESDEGGKEVFKFEAPKTQVMGIIINGLLNSKLRWDLILIGAAVAVTLELCGVSSLAFAVGVYIPMQYSAPIFLGGIIRWLIDQYLARQAHGEVDTSDPAARARAEVAAIAKSETNPSVLLASGYIAGGSMAGVLYAFLNFSKPLIARLDFTDRLDKMAEKAHEVFLQRDLPAILGLAVLLIFLLLTGMGKVFKSSEIDSDIATNGTEPDGTEPNRISQ
jgi:hypothetical protein